ncbi:MAG: alpha/beta hydrolase [Pseudomonas sp.]
MRFVPTLAMAAMALASPMFASAADLPTPPGAKNIVIVPGEFTDGSGWRVVSDILYWKGYKVTVVQPSHTSLEADIAATQKELWKQVGTVVLVGHGTGGSVISNAGTRGKVKSLVYVAALQPEVGETSGQLLRSMPEPSDDVKTDFAGYSTFDPAKFHDDFAADLEVNRTNFMALSQVPITQANLGTPSTAAVWRSKPTYAIVATDDRAMSPDLQRWMYKRAGSKVTEIKASHAVYISQPELVAKVIEEAAINAK